MGETAGHIDEEAKRRFDQMKDTIAFCVQQLAPEMVSLEVRRLLTSDQLVRNEIAVAVKERAQELLREWRAASPAGPVVSRTVIEKAVRALERCDACADEHDVDMAVEIFRKAGYFVV